MGEEGGNADAGQFVGVAVITCVGSACWHLSSLAGEVLADDEGWAFEQSVGLRSSFRAQERD